MLAQKGLGKRTLKRRQAAVVQQRVDQRAGGVARRQVHHHACGFVHHDQLIVLVDNVEWDGLRDRLLRGGKREKSGV